MKKLVLASLLLTGTGFANANADAAKLVSADGSELSQLCIAAVSSRRALVETADALGIDNIEPETLRCNGLPLQRFVGKYRSVSTSSEEEKEKAGYYFTRTDASEMTELCIAAVSSEQEYQRVKDTYFSAVENVENVVLCNGIPLKTFARRYAAPERTVSQL